MSEIKLGGGEISVLKAIGMSGPPMSGKLLVDRIEAMEAAEFIDTLAGLIDQDYVIASKVNVRSMEDVERSSFRVNPLHAKDLRDALFPGRKRDEGRRRRRA